MCSYSDQYVLVAVIASFLFGYQIAVLNTSLVFFTLQFNACGDTYTYRCPEATKWEALASTMVFIGATVGALTAGNLIYRGRRLALLVCGPSSSIISSSLQIAHLISIVGASICCFSYNFPMLLIGGLINGFCVGVITVASPSIISEMCPSKIRGSRGS